MRVDGYFMSCVYNLTVTTVTDRNGGNPMRSKDAALKNEIYDFVNDWKRDYGSSPSLKKIADKMQVSRTTVYRYLKDMTDDGVCKTGNYFC